MTFYERGRRAALADTADGAARWGDVPAQLTATYAEAPSKEEMRQYGDGYFSVVAGRGVDPRLVRFERSRLLAFIECGGRSACEPAFFGAVPPGADRRKPVRSRIPGR